MSGASGVMHDELSKVVMDALDSLWVTNDRVLGKLHARDEILAAVLNHPARVQVTDEVRTVAEANKQSQKTVLRDANGDIFERDLDNITGKLAWMMTGYPSPLSSGWIKFPARILFTPLSDK